MNESLFEITQLTKHIDSVQPLKYIYVTSFNCLAEIRVLFFLPCSLGNLTPPQKVKY